MKQYLIEAVKSWWTDPLPVIRPRHVDLHKLFDPNIKKIICVIGFRRAGKTFTLFDFAQRHGKEKIVYLNLEDERIPQETKVLTEFIEVVRELKGNQPLILILDEIQQIPNWSIWARRINETTPYHLILSGSSSKLSSREIPTELRGQTLTAQVFPLSFSEFQGFKNLDINALPRDRVLGTIREYLFFGGMPEIVLAQDEGIKPLILTEYYNSFVQRDIIDRYKIRNAEALRDLMRLCLNTRTYTFSKFANTLKSLGHKVGKATVVRYMKWLEDSFFYTGLDAFSSKVKQRIQSPKKGYVVDTYFPVRYASSFSDNIGHLMENAVYLHLLRMQAGDPLLEIYYWKDYSNNEVDFAVKRGHELKNLIQVTYASRPAEVEDRETRALIRAAKQLGCKNLTVVTWDYEIQSEFGGCKINFVPLWKFLSGTS